MIEDLTPMKYTEVGQGNYHRMMQQAFLKAHKLASEYGQRVEIISKIVVFPPDPRMPEAGNHLFEVQVKEPKYTSTRFTTILSGGYPVSDGKNIGQAIQTNLFNEPEIIENDEV